MPGVDIAVTSTQNSATSHTLSEAAGAFDAPPHVHGTVVLVWGSPPHDACDAQQFEELLSCRSKRGDSTRYPWINVDFRPEPASVDPEPESGPAAGAHGSN